MADFSFSTWYAAEDETIPLLSSWPWKAPECECPRGNEGSYEFYPDECRRMDVYCYELLCFWLTFEEMLSGIRSCHRVRCGNPRVSLRIACSQIWTFSMPSRRVDTWFRYRMCSWKQWACKSHRRVVQTWRISSRFSTDPWMLIQMEDQVVSLMEISGVSMCVPVGHPSSRVSQVLVSISTRRFKLPPEIQSTDSKTNRSFKVSAHCRLKAARY